MALKLFVFLLFFGLNSVTLCAEATIDEETSEYIDEFDEVAQTIKDDYKPQKLSPAKRALIRLGIYTLFKYYALKETMNSWYTIISLWLKRIADVLV